MLNCLKFYQIIHSIWPVCTPASTLYSQKWYPELIWLIACCKHARTLARQKWHHNYVIGLNEYLISTFSESTAHWVYSLQFVFKSTHNSWRYERKYDWFFSWTHCIFQLVQNWSMGFVPAGVKNHPPHYFGHWFRPAQQPYKPWSWNCTDDN